MKLILANPRGFCAGVHMAIDVVDQLLEICPDEQICVYHEIVHNQHVVQRFVDRGVLFVQHVEDVPPGSILVFSAHGVSPEIRKQADDRNLTSIDATCPLVTKVHTEAIRYAKWGWQIILIGHEDHQEVIGTRGEAPDAIQILETADGVSDLVIHDPEKLVYLTQTTLSTDDADLIINALKKEVPTIKAPPKSDICYATTNRQHAVRSIAPSCDLVLVVGSQMSSNSVRLTEISENLGTPARLIDDTSELNFDWLEGVETLLVTAGASAPDDLVNDLIITIWKRFKPNIEQWDIDRESIEFSLPRTLKNVMREKGMDPNTRTIMVDRVTDLERHLKQLDIPLQTIDLTVGNSD